MDDNNISIIAKEISDGCKSERRLLANSSEERVFFEQVKKASRNHNLTVNQTIEVLMWYVKHTRWFGLIVHDCSGRKGNSISNGSWALVRENGIFASFDGGDFVEIYEPSYEFDNSYTDKFYDVIDDDEETNLKSKNPDHIFDAYVKSIYGIDFSVEPEYDSETIFQDDGSRTQPVPKNFVNPIWIRNFANVTPYKKVIAVSAPLLVADEVTSVSEWVSINRNNRGVASSYEIISSAANDHYSNRDVVRQLKSWTDESFSQLRNSLRIIAAIWPEYLGGTLTFVSKSHDSKIIVEQEDQKPPLFLKENNNIKTSLSVVLEWLSGFRKFNGMLCNFDMSQEGCIDFNPERKQDLIVEIIDNYWPNDEERDNAFEFLLERISARGYPLEDARHAMLDPKLLGRFLDDNLKIHNSLLSRGYHFAPKSWVNPVKVKYNSNTKNYNAGWRGSNDSLYNNLGGNGDSSVYLSDGLWLSPDGSTKDEGR